MIKTLQYIEDTIPRLGGWSSKEKCQILAATVFALRPKLVHVIGVYEGRDTLAMALACKELGHGRVVATDPFNAKASEEGQVTDADRKWWGAVNHDVVYANCIKNLNEADVLQFVHINRKKSDDVAPFPCQMLIIDGNHSNQAVIDTERFAPLVEVGGVCLQDDVGWVGGGPQRACDMLLKMGFVKLYTIDSSAMYQRVRLK